MAKKEQSAAAEKIAAAEKVKAKKPKSDKPNIFVRAWKAIVRFFKDLRGETKKIVWPDGKTVLKSTGVVLAVVVVFTIVIWLIDLGLSKSIDLVSDAARNANDTTVTEVADDNTASQNLVIEQTTEAAAEAAAAEEVTAAEEAVEETAAAQEAAEETAAPTAAE
ncbi:MAG: preprotein translocase subunit SecE [Clostridia bacterium]|nr:preprotein translocase subunit SecE [Clostridia bacterium]